MRGVIVGTAGHIDHGKTTLVKALTGVDTDRLKEEKERGITIELGFAELAVEGRGRFGVVDVPGHEGFVRAMVAGAAGMDVVLLVVAADEGVMPQTREHVSIVDLLAVPELVVAITKCDAVEDEWLALVDADVAELLRGTRYAGSPVVHTSAVRGTGLDALVAAVVRAAETVGSTEVDDLVRLPLDRVFTIQGTGTVATGTLWSGRLRSGDKVRILPQDREARVRGVQVHDRDVEVALAGDRTAVALAGDGADRESLARGATLVTSPAWTASMMLTARVRVLPDAGWNLAHNQRVHVHHGTAEVLARCAMLEGRDIEPGGVGWVQLRLESPVAARALDRLVLRAYSPVTTLGGGEVAEPDPPKRNTLDGTTRRALERILDAPPPEALAAHLELRSWHGSPVAGLPIALGIPPTSVDQALEQVLAAGAVVAAGTAYDAAVRSEGEARVEQAVRDGLAADPLRSAVPLVAVRAALPGWAPPGLADVFVADLIRDGRLTSAEGGVSLPGHRAVPTPEQEAASTRLLALIVDGGLAAPDVTELPEDLRTRPDLWGLLRRLETGGMVRQVADGVFLGTDEIDRAAGRIRSLLGGRKNLGPADFREALDVSRKRLLPLLAHFDAEGVTVRRGEGRDVPSVG